MDGRLNDRTGILNVITEGKTGWVYGVHELMDG